jgi:copper(I)-binding protein
MRRLLLASAALYGPLPGTALPASAQQNTIAVTDAWSRAAMAGRMGVVYLTITDTGGPDRLTGASSPVAAKASLHESIDDHGVMKMRPVAALPVQPGSPVQLAPGGYHIMLEGLKLPLKSGETFPVTLTFANAGTVTATAVVQKGDGGMAMDHGSMGGMTMPSGSQPAAAPAGSQPAAAPSGSQPGATPGMNVGGTAQH